VEQNKFAAVLPVVVGGLVNKIIEETHLRISTNLLRFAKIMGERIYNSVYKLPPQIYFANNSATKFLIRKGEVAML
jgi:hypothetical protein